MYILLIAGIICIIAALALAAAGVLQCRKRIGNEKNFVPADAEVIRIESKTRIAIVKGVPVPVTAYIPVVRFRLDSGDDAEAAMPELSAIDSAYRDYKSALENGTALPITYDPNDPSRCIYGNNKPFRIREAVYKFLAAGLVGFIGYWLIWWHFNI